MRKKDFWVLGNSRPLSLRFKEIMWDCEGRKRDTSEVAMGRERNHSCDKNNFLAIPIGDGGRRSCSSCHWEKEVIKVKRKPDKIESNLNLIIMSMYCWINQRRTIGYLVCLTLPQQP